MLPVLLFVLLQIARIVTADTSYVLTPTTQFEDEVGVVIIQGAQCPTEGYEPLAKEIQRLMPMNTYVGVPEYIGNVPEPLQFGSKFKEVVNMMKDKGMNETTKIIVAAHSLGAVMAQSWVHDNALKNNVVGQVLLGATVLRKYRNKSYPVTTLTVDGTLDGLLHVTRQAEAYFHQVKGKSSLDDMDRPVVLLEGLNHWSFSSGTPPGNVKSNDLKAEVSTEEGHTMIAQQIVDFATMKVSDKDSLITKAMTRLESAVKNTGVILNPVVSALELSGYHYLQGPCDSDFPTNPTCQYPQWPAKSIGPKKGPPSPAPSNDCTCGSPWVANVAQTMMGGLDLAGLSGHVEISNKDAFHDVSDVRPFHLPHIFSPKPGTACDGTSKCTIETTTVTMPYYEKKDTLLDTGLYPVTADEFRTKLKSRQSIWESAGLTNVSFADTDKNNVSICKSINEAAYEWALGQASDVARKRFEANGQPYRFVDDVYAGIGITGPTWIHNALSFKVSNDKKYVEVSAPYFATENKNLGDEPYTNTVGYHYCKLLSPARAMEWIYVDGLRQFGHI